MSATVDPLLTILTVNYNGWEVTCRMIDSLQAHLHLPYEIIVVDNGSGQDEGRRLQERYPRAIVLHSSTNLGFAGGNNLGLNIARGKYILLINNDTFVEDGSLEYLCRAMDEHPTWGIVCPKIRFAAENRPIQFAGYTPLSRVTMRNRLIGFGEPDNGQWDAPATTPYAHGAAMMVRKDALSKAGLMPELYFLYYEELDWSLRFTEAGYRIGYEPRATVYHLESSTTGAESPAKTYYITRNRLFFAARNRRGGERIASILYQITVSVPKNMLFFMIKGRRDLAGAVWRGAAAFVSGQSGMDRHSGQKTGARETVRQDVKKHKS